MKHRLSSRHLRMRAPSRGSILLIALVVLVILYLYWPVIPGGKEIWGFLAGPVTASVMFVYGSMVAWGTMVIDGLVVNSTFSDIRFTTVIVTSILFCIGIYGGLRASHRAVGWKWIWVYGALVLVLLYLRGMEIVDFFAFIGVLTCIYEASRWAYDKVLRGGNQPGLHRHKTGTSMLALLCCVIGIGLITLEVGYWNPSFFTVDQQKGIRPSTVASSLSGTPATANSRSSVLSSEAFTTVGKAQKVLTYVNQLRAENGVSALRYDVRVYRLAIARVNDMDQYNYMDHTNPVTGTCPDSIKSQFGLSNNEYVAEDAYGFDYGGSYSSGLEQQAISSWMTSRGHRYNLLYPHTAGAVVCSRGGHCVFEGLNTAGFGSGCHTGAEGLAFWNSVGEQQYER